MGAELTSFRSFYQLAVYLDAVDHHAERANAGAFGDWEDVAGLQLLVGVIAEGLFDHGFGGLVLYGDGHFVAHHGQRLRFVFGIGNEQALPWNGHGTAQKDDQGPTNSGTSFPLSLVTASEFACRGSNGSTMICVSGVK